MKISDDRSELDELLADETSVLLILYGSKAQAIYDLATKGAQPWRKVVLMGNLSKLTPEETSKWGLTTDSYVVLKKDKTVSSRGALSQFCDQTGTPAILKINGAFAQADI
jgi:hypothetical protein